MGCDQKESIEKLITAHLFFFSLGTDGYILSYQGGKTRYEFGTGNENVYLSKNIKII